MFTASFLPDELLTFGTTSSVHRLAKLVLDVRLQFLWNLVQYDEPNMALAVAPADHWYRAEDEI